MAGALPWSPANGSGPPANDSRPPASGPARRESEYRNGLDKVITTMTTSTPMIELPLDLEVPLDLELPVEVLADNGDEGAGESEMARRVAERYGFEFIDMAAFRIDQ